MQDIKTFIIGFLTCGCIFLIMGQVENKEIELKNMERNVSDGKTSANLPKYQFAVQRGIDIGETYYLYDNENSDLKILHTYKSEEGEQKWSAIKINFDDKYKKGAKSSSEALDKAKSLFIGK